MKIVDLQAHKWHVDFWSTIEKIYSKYLIICEMGHSASTFYFWWFNFTTSKYFTTFTYNKVFPHYNIDTLLLQIMIELQIIGSLLLMLISAEANSRFARNHWWDAHTPHWHLISPYYNTLSSTIITNTNFVIIWIKWNPLIYL